jgi:hypothetical protein
MMFRENDIRKLRLIIREVVHVEKPKEYGASSYMWFASGDADTSDQENYNL